MDIINVLIVFIVLAIIMVLEVDSYTKLRDLYKLAKVRNSPIPDAKYFELKSSIRLITILFTATIFIFGFFGVDSYYTINDNVEKFVKDNTSQVINKYDSLLYKWSSLESDYRSINIQSIDLLKTLDSSYIINLSRQLNYDRSINKDMEEVNKLIEELSQELLEIKKLKTQYELRKTEN